MKWQSTSNFPRLGEIVNSLLFTLMSPVSNSDRLEVDRPRRETRIVYTREDRRPIRESGLDRAGIWSKRDRNVGAVERGGVSRVRLRRDGGDRCRGSVSSIRTECVRIRNAVVCQRVCLALPCLALDRHRRRIYRCRSTCARSPRSPSREEPRMQARASRGPRESDSRLAAALRLTAHTHTCAQTRELRIYACRVAYARFATWYNYYVKYRDIHDETLWLCESFTSKITSR